MSWFITGRLAGPIRRTADAAARVASGDYSARVPASQLGTEFAQLDAAFNQMAAALEHAEQRRQDLLADLAHELRTPVATLDGYLEGVEDGVLPTSVETWHTMCDQTSRLRRLNLQTAPVDITALATEAIRAAEPAFRAQVVALVLNHRGPAARVVGDHDRLWQVLDNLLANALRHTPADGHVTVKVAGHRGEVELTFTDDGEGITAEQLPHVFGRFYRVDPARSRSTGAAAAG